VYRRIERLIEGSREQRLKAARSGSGGVRSVAKHAAFILPYTVKDGLVRNQVDVHLVNKLGTATRRGGCDAHLPWRQEVNRARRGGTGA
jgi:hypothetical protein